MGAVGAPAQGTVVWYWECRGGGQGACTFWMRSSLMSLSLELPLGPCEDPCCFLPCLPFCSFWGASACAVLCTRQSYA